MEDHLVAKHLLLGECICDICIAKDCKLVDSGIISEDEYYKTQEENSCRFFRKIEELHVNKTVEKLYVKKH